MAENNNSSSEKVSSPLEQHAIIEALKKSERFLTSVVENIPDMVFIKDAKDLKILMLNKAGEEMLGIERAAVLGKSDYDLFPKEQADFFTGKDRQVLKSKQLLDIPEEMVGTKEGGRYGHTKKIPILNEKGETIYLLGITEDITEKKKAIEAFTEGARDTMVMINAIPESLILIERNGKIVSGNEMAAKRFKLRTSELIGKYFYELVPKELAEKRRAMMESVFTTGTPFLGVDERDGMVFDTSIFPVFDSKGKVTRIAVYSAEITERRFGENLLRERNQTLERISKLAVDLAELPQEIKIQSFLVRRLREISGAKAVWFGNYNHKDKNIVVSDFEADPGLMEKAIKILGKLPGEIKSPVSEETYRMITAIRVGKFKTLTEVSFGAIPSVVGKVVQKLLGVDRFIGMAYFIEGALYGTTILGMGEDKSDPSLDFLEAFTQLVAVTLRQRQAESELATSQLEYKNLIENINDVVYSIDSKGVLLYASPVIKKLLGYEPEELIGKNMTTVFYQDKEQLERLKSDFESITKGQTISNEYRFVTKTGEIRWVRTSTKPVYENEVFIGIRGVLMDIDEQKKAHEAMDQAQKLESLGIIAGGIAHDFNNLLSGIFGHLEAAKLKAKGSPEVLDNLDKSLQVFSRAKDLTHQLLTFSKGGKPAKKTGDLKVFLKKVAEFVLSGSTVTLELDLQEDIWLCDFDENQISRVIENLVINSIQAMPQGGKLSISAKNRVLTEGALPSKKAVGKFIVVSIKDTGMGIPGTILPKIFDPFFTTKAQGSGLGLSTVYSIVKKHEGFIYAHSAKGQGTTFTIYLPASQNTVLGRSEVEKTKTAQLRKGGRILIMDDEEGILELVKILLEDAGYTVFTAKTGEEALKVCETEKIELILSDLTVAGGQGGKELLAGLRASGNTVPVIASSGYSADDIMANPMKYGFAGKLAKPYLAEELLEVVAKNIK